MSHFNREVVPANQSFEVVKIAAQTAAWEVTACSDCLRIIFEQQDDEHDYKGPISFLLDVLADKASAVFEFLDSDAVRS